jgi:hypothetical protein
MMDSVIRLEKKSDYTVLSNHAIKDPRLSFRACGVLWHLLSKPDGWQFNHKEITEAHTEGRDAVRSALSELKDLGYLSIQRHAQGDGTISWVWTVREAPCTGNPHMVDHVLETRTYSSTDTRYLVETESNTATSKLSSKGNPEVDAVFAHWEERRAKATGRNGPKMQKTKVRLSKINARLKEGYTVDQLKQAIDGCFTSEYNVTNGYYDIELILRNQAKVEQYRSWAQDNKSSGADRGSSLYEEYVPQF